MKVACRFYLKFLPSHWYSWYLEDESLVFVFIAIFMIAKHPQNKANFHQTNNGLDLYLIFMDT